MGKIYIICFVVAVMLMSAGMNRACATYIYNWGMWPSHGCNIAGGATILEIVQIHQNRQCILVRGLTSSYGTVHSCGFNIQCGINCPDVEDTESENINATVAGPHRCVFIPGVGNRWTDCGYNLCEGTATPICCGGSTCFSNSSHICCNNAVVARSFAGVNPANNGSSFSDTIGSGTLQNCRCT